VRVDGVAFDIPVPAYGARMALVERGTGKLLVATGKEPLRRVV
jgi:hypothetical protein